MTNVPCPRSSIPGSSSWTIRIGATPWAMRNSGYCPIGVSMMLSIRPGPMWRPLFTTTSTPPHASVSCPMAASTDSRLVRSIFSGSARRPACSTRAAVSSRLPGSGRLSFLCTVCVCSGVGSELRTVRAAIATS